MYKALLTKNSNTIIIVSGIGLIALVIRVWFISEPMRWDEAKAFLWTKTWSWRVVQFYENVGNHIFHTVSVLVTTTLLGPEPWKIRLPVLISGVLLVPVTYVAFANIVPRAIALLTSLFVATSPYLIFYSVNSRGYVIQTLLVICVIPFVHRLTITRSYFSLVATAVLLALACYTLPTTISILPAIVVWGLYLSYQRGNWPGVFASLKTYTILIAIIVVASFVFYFPVFQNYTFDQILAIRDIESKTIHDTAISLTSRIGEVASVLTTGQPVLFTWLFWILLFVGSIYLFKLHRASFYLVVLVWISMFGVAFALRNIPPVRGYLLLLPFTLLMVAAGICAVGLLLRNKKRYVPVVMLSTVFAVVPLIGMLQSDYIRLAQETGRMLGAERAVHFLSKVIKSPDHIAPGYAPMKYYARLHGYDFDFFGVRHFDQGDLKKTNDLYVVVRLNKEQSISTVLKNRFDVPEGAITDRYDRPRLVGVFEDIEIYLLKRRVGT